MAEDFLGYGGRLDEEFVHAENKSIKTEPFEKFEVRACVPRLKSRSFWTGLCV